MLELVTISEAAAHIRTDSDADNAWFETWIPAISQAIAAWLKEPWRLYVVARSSQGKILLDSSDEPIVLEDSNGQPIINPSVRAATLIELAQQYRFRDGSDAAAVPSHAGYGYVLGVGATALLSSLRKTTLA